MVALNASGALDRPATTAVTPTGTTVGANNQPVTKVVNATRALMLGGPTATPVLHAALWTLAALVVFVPLAVHRYRTARLR